MKQRIEVEHRARFSRQKFLAYQKFLRRHARSLGRDDKEVFFYVAPNFLYKVVKNISAGTAKIVFKNNRIERSSSFDEIEIAITQRDIEAANTLLSSMSKTKLYYEKIRRENFLWRGVEIALKYSPTWGYHAEFEVLVASKKMTHEANIKIQSVAKALGIRLMTTNDIAKFLRAADREKK